MSEVKKNQNTTAPKVDTRKTEINKFSLIFNQLGIWIFVAALIILGMIISRGQFFSKSNIQSILEAVALVGMVCAGLFYITYSGNMTDMSVPITMAFGDVSLNGGKGSVVGTFGGVLAYGILNNILSWVGLGTYSKYLVQGMGMLWACHFQDVCAAFGMQTCLMNMVSDPEMVHYVDDHIVDFYLKALKIFLDATKGKVQAILIGDDVGSQRGLMISPALIKEFVIPGAKKLIELAHSYGVKVMYHSCGSIVEAIPLLIEAGVDIIHPIQALAAGMDPANLKSKFDGQISFCGGVDTQDLLPNGTPEMVAAKVKELRTFFPTGLIVSPSHEGLQLDVPPVNIKALFDEATKIYE